MCLPDTLHGRGRKPHRFFHRPQRPVRSVQCAASGGGGAWPRRITSAVLSAAVLRMPGGRVFSCNKPTTPATMNRSCQRQTQVAGLPVADMIALVPVPSADKSTIRARQTCFCGEDGAEMIAARRRRSPGDTINPIPMRTSLNRTSGNTTESKFGLLRSGQSTRLTRSVVCHVPSMKCWVRVALIWVRVGSGYRAHYNPLKLLGGSGWSG